jgi:hypothetical protein
MHWKCAPLMYWLKSQVSVRVLRVSCSWHTRAVTIALSMESALIHSLTLTSLAKNQASRQRVVDTYILHRGQHGGYSSPARHSVVGTLRRYRHSVHCVPYFIHNSAACAVLASLARVEVRACAGRRFVLAVMFRCVLRVQPCSSHAIRLQSKTSMVYWHFVAGSSRASTCVALHMVR